MTKRKKADTIIDVKAGKVSTGKYVDKAGYTGKRVSVVIKKGGYIDFRPGISEMEIGRSVTRGASVARAGSKGGEIIDIEHYHPLYANPIALLNSSKSGLAASAAIDFINLSGFTHSEFQTTFQTTVKTIQNYATRQLKLDSVLSEKLLKAFSLFEKGIGVFGSAQAFHDWLNQPAYGLGNQKPYELMDTITGIILIEEELIRLEYGDLA